MSTFLILQRTEKLFSIRVRITFNCRVQTANHEKCEELKALLHFTFNFNFTLFTPSANVYIVIYSHNAASLHVVLCVCMFVVFKFFLMISLCITVFCHCVSLLIFYIIYVDFKHLFTLSVYTLILLFMMSFYY